MACLSTCTSTRLYFSVLVADNPEFGTTEIHYQKNQLMQDSLSFDLFPWQRFRSNATKKPHFFLFFKKTAH